MSAITTHILDIAKGLPASGVPVMLCISETGYPPKWKILGQGVTDDDGRLKIFQSDDPLLETVYKITFLTGNYFAAQKVKGFYPEVTIVFTVRGQKIQHYHVPLLLSPYGYSTYRGS